MTNRQRIELRLSEVRQRLNEISGLEGDAFTDEIREEADKLQREYGDLEVRHRAAIVADPDPEPNAGGEGDGEDREILELRSRVSIADYIEAANAGRPVAGAAAEYNAALDMAEGRFPLQLLDDPGLETRATTDTDGRVNQGTWIDRLFADTAARRVGVTFASVAPGQVSYPVTTAGASAAQRGRTEAAADAAWTVGATAIEPTRNSVRAVFSRTDALRLPGLEAALQRDLRAALAEGIDRAIFVGDSGANENDADITGLTTAGITEAVIAQADKLKAVETLQVFTNLVDGVYAAGMGDLRIVAAIGAWRLWASTVHTAATSPQTIAEFLRAAGLSWSSRGGIETDTADGDFAAFVGLGRGIANAAVAAVWSDAEMIRDPYSAGSQAQISLTLHTHWGFKIPRTANFKRVKFAA